MKRIEQKLFLDIVRQSYEADKAWKDYIEKYKITSNDERELYIDFSIYNREMIKIKNPSMTHDEITLYILNKWDKMTDKEIKDWRHRNRLKFLCQNVSTLLSIFNIYA
jgi:hypothetical protein